MKNFYFKQTKKWFNFCPYFSNFKWIIPILILLLSSSVNAWSNTLSLLNENQAADTISSDHLKKAKIEAVSTTSAAMAVAALKAEFTANPKNGCSLPYTVFFTDQSITPDTWSWNFGDGGTSTAKNPIHTYTAGGLFVVKLTITDTIIGGSDFYKDTIRITVPTADFTGSSLFGCGPFSTNFTDNSSVSGPATITGWSWNFGDGGTSTQQSPSHTYDTPGTYTVSLTITLSNGCTNTKTRTNYVQVIGPSVAFSTTSTTIACPPANIIFTNGSSSGSPITSWSWNFGDGNTSSIQNPTHNYTTSGSFNVSLKLTDLDGCSRTLTKNNFINTTGPNPPSITCPGNRTENANSNYQFSIPDYTSLATVSDDCDPSPSVTQSPTAGTVVALGTTSITLTATDASANSSNCSFNINVVDVTPPTLTISSIATNPTNSAFTATFTFSEQVTGFTVADITSTNASVSNFNTSSAKVYTASITPAADGTVNVSVAAAVAKDPNGNDNTASSVFSVTADITPPTVITQNINAFLNATGSVTITAADVNNGTNDTYGIDTLYLNSYDFSCSNIGANTVTLTAKDNNANMASTNATVTVKDTIKPNIVTKNINLYLDATGNATLTVPDIDNGTSDACGINTLTLDTYTFNLSHLGANTVTLTATDVNTNVKSGTAIVTVIDTFAPAAPVILSFDTDNGTSTTDRLTSDNTLTFTGTAEANSTVELFMNSISAGTTPADGSGNWTFDNTSNIISDGVYSITATAKDISLNTSPASTALGITIDTAKPTVSIANTAGAFTNGAFEATFTVSKTAFGFVQNDVSVSNATISNFTGSGTHYTATITPTNNDTVKIQVDANKFQDTAGNYNMQSNQFNVVYDNIAPQVQITTNSEEYTNSPFTATIIFSEKVSNFDQSDISFSNALPGYFRAVDSGLKYAVDVFPQEEGNLSIHVMSDVAEDIAHNKNLTSNEVNITYDKTPPIPVISSTVTGKINSAFNVFIAFNEPVTGFEMLDISATNAKIKRLRYIDNSTCYVTVTPITNGMVSVYIEKGKLFDLAGNANEATESYTVEFDNTAPEIICPDTITVAENSNQVTTVKSNDKNIVTYSLTGGIDDQFFEINAESGELNFINAPDAELPSDADANNFYEVLLTASGGMNYSHKPVTVKVTDVNDNTPVIDSRQLFVITENLLQNSIIDTFSVYDADISDQNFIWKIESDTDINGNGLAALKITPSTGELMVNDSSDFNREITDSISITVSVNDGLHTSNTAKITLKLTDLNDEVPIIDGNHSFAIDENSAKSAVIGTLSYTDADVTPTDDLNWILTTNVDEDRDGIDAVAIDPGSGELTVSDADEFDYEQREIMTITAQVTDGINSSNPKSFTITLNNLNDEAPVIAPDQIFNIDDNSAAGTDLSTLVATDVDNNTTFSGWTIVENYDTNKNGTPALAINAISGSISVNDAADIDYETITNFSIFVTVTDGVNVSEKQEVHLKVNNVDESGTGVSFEKFSTAIKVYPNPASNQLNIEAPSGCEVTLYDVNGRILKSMNMNESRSKINVGDLKRGNYFLQIQLGYNHLTKDILIK